jgi:hypothetical protein
MRKTFGVVLSLCLLVPGLAAQSVSPFAGRWTVTISHLPDTRHSLAFNESPAGFHATEPGQTYRAVVSDRTVTYASDETWKILNSPNGRFGTDDQVEMYATVYRATIQDDGTLKGFSEVYIRGYGAKPIKRVDWTAIRER